MMTACLTCGEPMTVSHEDYEYTSLPGTILRGIEIRRCACGEEEIVIPRLGPLNDALAKVVTLSPRPLTPAEFRFLRKSLGWSGKDTAARLGVDSATLSRWEQSKQPISPMADRALRLAVAVEQPIRDYRTEALTRLEEGDRAPIRMELGSNGWHASAA